MYKGGLDQYIYSKQIIAKNNDNYPVVLTLVNIFFSKLNNRCWKSLLIIIYIYNVLNDRCETCIIKTLWYNVNGFLKDKTSRCVQYNELFNNTRHI